ncbi:hypothetical protein [Williamsia sp.]|uniref:hypothetical protein n=1 Tax=Williamsia sp. TaxID=1872085 RepID=UPI002F948A8C
MAPSARQGADVEQARYFALELARWIDKLEHEIGHVGETTTVITAKRHELDDVRRQLDALRTSFPAAFL